MPRLLLLSPLFLVAACDNPCQAICVEMAQYAEECGYDVPSEELQTCRTSYATSDLANEQAQECIVASDPQQLREWWSCDDVVDNFQNVAR